MMVDQSNNIWSVVIIGAGAAGLQCNRLLKAAGVSDVLLVEASDRIGGRIRTSTSVWPGHKVDLGAEYLHGSSTSLNRMAEEQGWTTYEVFTLAQIKWNLISTRNGQNGVYTLKPFTGDGGPSDKPANDFDVGYYYLGDQQRLLPHDSKDPEFCHLNEVLWDMISLQHDKWEANESLLNYLEKQNLSDSMMALAEAGYANTAGAPAKELSFMSTCRNERQWAETDGDNDYRFAESMGQVIEFLQQDVKSNNTKLNWAVKSITTIDDDGGYVALENENGDVVKTKKVVITVPISVMPSIQFKPPLSDAKVDAMNSFGMRRALKIHLLFTDMFWPAECHGVISTHSIIPELWMDSEPGNVSMITGFATGEFADKIVGLEDDDVAISMFLTQLDKIFGSKDAQKPATSKFIRGKVFDWGSEPFIKGGYSYPKPGQRPDAAADLAEPVAETLFFAGEATAAGQPAMTVHAALDTGSRAAKEVLESLSTSDAP